MALQEAGVSLVAENKARFLADMDSAVKSVGSFGDAAGKASGGLAKIGEAGLKVGADLAKLGLAAGAAAAAVTGAFAVKSAQAFGDFQAAILQSKSVLDKADWAENGKKVEDLAIQLGADLPISAKDAALGFAELAKAGFKTNEILDSGRGLATLAVAGQLDMARSSEILSAALQGFQLPATAAGHVADLLAKTANASAVSVDDLGETFKYIAPAAKAAGFSIEDMSIAIGLMGNAGLKGSMAGTALRSTITRLAAPPKDAALALQHLGVAAFDATGKSRPFRDILVDLQSKFAGLSEQQAVNYAKSIAGQEAMSGFLAVVKSSPEDFEKMRYAVDNSNGAAGEMAGVLSEGLNGSIENLKGSIESFMIKAGRPLGIVFEDVVRQATEIVNKMSPLGEAFGTKLADSMKTISDALKSINWQELIDKGKPIVETILTITTALNPLSIGIELLSGILSGNVDKSLSNIGERFGKVGEIIGELAPKLVTAASELLQKLLMWVADNGPKIATELLKWGLKLVEWIAPEIPKLLEAAGKLVASMTAWFISDGLPLIINTLTKWGVALWEWVEKSWPDWLKTAMAWAEKVWTWLGEQVPILVEQLGKWGAALVDWVIDSVPKWLKEATKFINKILDWVLEQTPTIGNKLKEWVTAFTDWITKDLLPKLPGYLGDMISTIAKYIADVAPKLLKIGADIGGNIWQGVMRSVPIVGGAIADAGNAVGTFLDPNTGKANQLQDEYNRNKAAADAAYQNKQIGAQQYETYLTQITEIYQQKLKQLQGYATGTRHAPGGWSMVGEAGPELAYLPYGSQVMPAAMTAAQIGQMGNNYNYNYNYNSGGNTYNTNNMSQSGGGGQGMGFDQFSLMNRRG